MNAKRRIFPRFPAARTVSGKGRPAAAGRFFLLIAAAAVLTLSLAGAPAYADDDEDDAIKISRISLKVTSNLSKTERDDVTVTETGENYSVDGYELQFTGSDYWEPTEYPRIVIYVTADDGYEFKDSVNVTLRGDVFEVIKKQKQDDDYVAIWADLNPYGGNVGHPRNPRWSGTSTAVWDKGYHNQSFNLVLLQGSKKVVTLSDLTANSIDLSSYMEDGCTYTYRVNAESQKDKSSVWVESGETTFEASGSSRWVMVKKKWTYQFSDGTLAQNGWYELTWLGDTNWYYFDENGYMLADTLTPDGYYVGADGVWAADSETEDSQAETTSAETAVTETTAAVKDQRIRSE